MPTQPGAFRIKWGKLSIALIGMLALVAVPVTLVLAVVTSLSLLAPLVCAVLVVLCLASLRAGAVVSRRRSAWERAASVVPADASEEHSAEQVAQAEHSTKAEQTAKESAASQQAAEEKSSAEKASRTAEREDAPFDIVADGRERTRRERAAARAAVAGEAAASSTATAERTDAEQARNEQAAPAAKGEKTAQGEATTSGTATPAAREGEKWAPRELPTPTYLAAEPAERALPAPLEQDEEKTATEVTSIRQAEAQRLAAERTQRLDLDAVLQRRRA